MMHVRSIGLECGSAFVLMMHNGQWGQWREWTHVTNCRQCLFVVAATLANWPFDRQCTRPKFWMLRRGSLCRTTIAKGHGYLCHMMINRRPVYSTRSSTNNLFNPAAHRTLPVRSPSSPLHHLYKCWPGSTSPSIRSQPAVQQSSALLLHIARCSIFPHPRALSSHKLLEPRCHAQHVSKLRTSPYLCCALSSLSPSSSPLPLSSEQACRRPAMSSYMHNNSLSVPEQGGRNNSISTGSNMSNGLHDGNPTSPLQPRALAQARYNTTRTTIISVWRFLRKRTNLTFWIIVGMIIGLMVGSLAPDFAVSIGPLGTVFIRMIQCIVVSVLVVAIPTAQTDLEVLISLFLTLVCSLFCVCV